MPLMRRHCQVFAAGVYRDVEETSDIGFGFGINGKKRMADKLRFSEICLVIPHGAYQ